MIQRQPFRLEDASRYPLFTPDLISLMQEKLSQDRQAEVATAVTIEAVKPG